MSVQPDLEDWKLDPSAVLEGRELLKKTGGRIFG
jgi:hypothetical protein